VRPASKAPYCERCEDSGWYGVVLEDGEMIATACNCISGKCGEDCPVCLAARECPGCDICRDARTG
jgi:hypothetical protein